MEYTTARASPFYDIPGSGFKYRDIKLYGMASLEPRSTASGPRVHGYRRAMDMSSASRDVAGARSEKLNHGFPPDILMVQTHPHMVRSSDSEPKVGPYSLT